MFSIILDDLTKIEVFKYIQRNASQINTINNLDDYLRNKDRNINYTLLILNIPRETILIILSYIFLVAITGNNIIELFNKYKHFNFKNLVKNTEKSKCLINYFVHIKDRINVHSTLIKNVTISKKVAQKGIFYQRNNCVSNSQIYNSFVSMNTPLSVIRFTTGTYNSKKKMKTIFVSKNIGGDILGDSCDEEEIQFLVSPECLIAVLYFYNESIKNNEAFYIDGVEHFSNYNIINYTFKFNTKNIINNYSNYEIGRSNIIIAIRDTDNLYLNININQKINKYIVVFGSWRKEDNLTCLTSNWGGDPQLELIIQWIAASITNRYLSYNIDENLFSLVTYFGADDFQSIIQEIRNRYPTVSELYNACIRICNSENKHNIIIQLLS